MAVRGIRGAVSVTNNSPEEITQATKELLKEIMIRNDVDLEEIASAFFSMTQDLNAEFPAKAARELGWGTVPMMCTVEIDVPWSVQGIIRVLIHINTDKSQAAIRHVYLKKAIQLRPDWSK